MLTLWYFIWNAVQALTPEYSSYSKGIVCSLDSAFLRSSSPCLLCCSASFDDQDSAELHQKIWTSCWNARGHESILTAPQTRAAHPPAAAAAQVSPDTADFVQF